MKLRTSQIETLRLLERYPGGAGPGMVAAEINRDLWSAEKRLARLVQRGAVREHVAEVGWNSRGERYELRLYQLTDEGSAALKAVTPSA